MKLLIPYHDRMLAADERLIRLAEFLGIECDSVPLSTGDQLAARLGSAGACCLAVNPDVFRQWASESASPALLAALLKANCRCIVVHAVRTEPFHDELIAALSAGDLIGVRGIEAPESGYSVAYDAKDVCANFAGLSFGPANAANDRTFMRAESSTARTIISVAGSPLMAQMHIDGVEVFFLGSEDIADLETPAAGSWVIEYFSRLLPHAMALRHFFGAECWQPGPQHATIVVDDPLLRANYGFLNFDKLLAMTRERNFHTTIAFIPYNFRRSSSRIVRLFHENADRLSLCFHGNDHTGAEFAARDEAVLNTMLHVAERRIAAHTARTGLACDRVMVFPQGQFSVEAMTTLRARNYDAVVNTVTHPRHLDVNPSLGEMAQPAVLRYGGFPLFLRRSSQNTHEPEIAFNLFFGRPVLIVEHHNIFEDPKPLLEAVDRINAVAPGIGWSRLSTAVGNSLLRRAGSDGTIHIRAYARAARIVNIADVRRWFLVEWPHPQCGSLVDGVTMNGAPLAGFLANASGVRVQIDLDSGASAALAIIHRASSAALTRFGVRHSARAFVRRRLSEVRDNYLSRNPQILAAAKAVQKKLQHG